VTQTVSGRPFIEEDRSVHERFDVLSGTGRRVAVNKLNKQPRTADEGWSSSLGVGRGANNSFP
jgi:hypothetical protein